MNKYPNYYVQALRAHRSKSGFYKRLIEYLTIHNIPYTQHEDCILVDKLDNNLRKLMGMRLK